MVTRTADPQTCLWCERSFLRRVRGKFCSNACQAEWKTALITQEWLEGKRPGYYGRNMQIAGFVKLYLADMRGAACERCGWDEVHPEDNRFLVQVDHIDGDAKNCCSDNLRLLCPNCHAMTHNFGNRNKKSARVR